MVSSSHGRLGELDALRGLAALTVILGHFSAANIDETKIWHGPKTGLLLFILRRPFTTGHTAVLLFFILSGLVLALPSVNQKQQNYGVFITRRVFRLYVPYLAALALAVFGNLCWHGSLGLTPWANQTWYYPVRLHAVLEHVLFLGQYNVYQFNTAFWSLVIEMRISILFPLLCLIVLRINSWVSIVSIAVISIAVSYFETLTGLNALEMNCYYLGFFVAGILLAQHKELLVSWVFRLSKRVALVYLGVALFLYWYGTPAAMLAIKYGLKVTNVKLIGYEWVSGVGALMLIILGLGFSPFSKLLLSKIPQFLGRISYSIYLIHGTVLFALLYLLSKSAPPILILLIYIPTVLLGSALMYRFVEKPAMSFSHRITSSARRPYTYSPWIHPA